jgi:hypothetical protein
MAENEESKQHNKQKADIKSHSDTMVGIVVKDVILNLQASRFEKAADQFLKAQENGILPANRTIVKKLLEILGDKTANQLITAFAFHPCQFCSKGRTKCDICKGSGHIEQNAVCERCSGLGVARCGFCNGSGLLALADIPEGIRAPAFIMRAEKTLKDAEQLLKIPIPDSSADNPGSALKKCAALWVAMDKLLGVLENIIVTFKSSMISSSEYDNQLQKVTDLGIQIAEKLTQRIREVVSVMQKLSLAEAGTAPSGSPHAKMAKNRADFYQSLANKADLIYDLSYAHPLIEDIIKKRFGDKSADNRGSQM